MNESPSPFFLLGDENLQRGIMLRQQHRYADARSYLAKAIEANPDQAMGHFQMALCYLDWENHDKLALLHIDRAIALNPLVADFFAIKAVLMGNRNKHREADRLADEALALNPQNLNALNVKTRTLSSQAKWREMEASARTTLDVEADDEVAANFLAFALRQQGRYKESDQITADLLARVPENAWAQTNAGWSALEGGNHYLANVHFLTALRLQPDYPDAREGLLHAINSRVWIYRVYLRLHSLFCRFSGAGRWSIIIYLFLLLQFSNRVLHHYFGHLGGEVVWLLLIVYCAIFAYGRELGNFFLLLHPFARHALTREDKWWSFATMLGYCWLLYSSFKYHFWTGMILLPALAVFFLVGVLASARESNPWSSPSR